MVSGCLEVVSLFLFLCFSLFSVVEGSVEVRGGWGEDLALLRFFFSINFGNRALSVMSSSSSAENREVNKIFMKSSKRSSYSWKELQSASFQGKTHFPICSVRGPKFNFPEVAPQEKCKTYSKRVAVRDWSNIINS